MLVILVTIFTVLSFLFHSDPKQEDENEEYQKMDNYVLYYHKPSGYYYESVSFIQYYTLAGSTVHVHNFNRDVYSYSGPLKSGHAAIAAKITGTDCVTRVKVTLKSSHLAILLNGQKVQAETAILLA